MSNDHQQEIYPGAFEFVSLLEYVLKLLRFKHGVITYADTTITVTIATLL